MSEREVLRVGRSSQADVCVESDTKLADVHFAIEGDGDGWHLRATRGAKVGVNSVPETHCQLKHGDCILAGQTEFRVTIEGYQESSPALATSAPTREQPVIKTPATYRTSSCNSGVIQTEVTLNDEPLIDVLEKICGPASLWVAINEQRLGGPVQGVEKQTEDLFAQAPEEIRETDSLIVASFPREAQVLANIQAAARADGAVLFVSTQSFPQILAEQKIVWAWYSRPSILKQQLSLGSKELAKKLLAAVDMAVLLHTVGSDVLILSRADVNEALQGRLKAVSV